MRATDTLFSTTAQFQILRAPTSSNGTTFGPGNANNLLKSNGTSVYWTTLAASDIPNLSTDKLTSGTLNVTRGGTGQTSIANIQAGKDGDGNTISSTYLKLSGGTLTGDTYFNSNTGSRKFYITRTGITRESAGMWVNDSYFYIDVLNDETAANVQFKLQATDIEANDGIGAQTSYVRFYGVNSKSTVAADYFTGNLTGNVTGNVSGTAANVTGTVAIEHGGTGSTTEADARSNLGLGNVSNNNNLNNITGSKGDIIYWSATNTPAHLTNTSSTTKQFLSITNQVPSWSSVSKSDVGLGNVENTALSTWAGTNKITTLGTITTGTWQGTTIAASYIGNHSTDKLTSGTLPVARGGTGVTSIENIQAGKDGDGNTISSTYVKLNSVNGQTITGRITLNNILDVKSSILLQGGFGLNYGKTINNVDEEVGRIEFTNSASPSLQIILKNISTTDNSVLGADVYQISSSTATDNTFHWYDILTSKNYTDYTVTKTGSGASGTWGISVTGNAANVTGTVAVDHGGTGATTAANARTNLGLGSIATYDAVTAGTKDTWGLVPVIGASDGVMEIGKYIDFHTTDGNTADYDVRISATTSGLTISGTTTGTFSGNLTGNATTATKATQDADGNTISSTYLKKSGGTMTGNLSVTQATDRVYLYLTANSDQAVDIRFSNANAAKWALSSRGSSENNYFGLFNHMNSTWSIKISNDNTVTLAKSLPIASGGTGAASAKSARTNLHVAAFIALDSDSNTIALIYSKLNELQSGEVATIRMHGDVLTLITGKNNLNFATVGTVHRTDNLYHFNLYRYNGAYHYIFEATITASSKTVGNIYSYAGTTI